MEIKNEQNENANYEKKEEQVNKKAKKTGLNKWVIVGATLAVAGITAIGAYALYQYNYNQVIAGDIQIIDSLQIQTFNAQFEEYFGTNKSRQITKSLIN